MNETFEICIVYQTPSEKSMNNIFADFANLTLRGPCIVIYSYNKTNETHSFLKFILEIEFYIFQTVSPSIIRSLLLYTQQ